MAQSIVNEAVNGNITKSRRRSLPVLPAIPLPCWFAQYERSQQEMQCPCRSITSHAHSRQSAPCFEGSGLAACSPPDAERGGAAPGPDQLWPVRGSSERLALQLLAATDLYGGGIARDGGSCWPVRSCPPSTRIWGRRGAGAEEQHPQDATPRSGAAGGAAWIWSRAAD